MVPQILKLSHRGTPITIALTKAGQVLLDDKQIGSLYWHPEHPMGTRWSAVAVGCENDPCGVKTGGRTAWEAATSLFYRMVRRCPILNP